MSVRNLLPKGKGSVILSASLLCKLKIKPSLVLCSRLSQNSACILCGGAPKGQGRDHFKSKQSFVKAP